MKGTIEVLEFLKKETRNKTLDENTDLFESGIVGDDFHELMDKFWETFEIDMQSYLWYFHCDEEGQNFWGLFFKPPYKRVERIPITAKRLTEFVKKGKWDISYPDHKLPKRRYDIILNQIFAAGIGMLILYKLITWIITKLS